MNAKPPPAVDPLRIFLCHASGDKGRVRDLYHRLRADGLAPWLDEEDLLPGQDWEREIRRAVRNADIVLVCLSQQSVVRKGYVQKEIRIALDVADEQPEGTIFIIPARLEACEVPERLRPLHWVDLFEPRGYERLLEALRQRADGPVGGQQTAWPGSPGLPAGRIAYVGRDQQLHVLDVATGEDTPIPLAGRPYSPRWSPDGRRIVYGEELSTSPRRSQIAVLDSATRRSQILVRPEVRSGNALQPPVDYFNYHAICWTPSGDAIVYKKASGARMHNSYMRVPAGGGPPEELQGGLTAFFLSTSDFDLSPTDGRMAITDNGLDHNAGSGQLVIADLDSSNRRVVRQFGAAYYASPVWTADGREIAVVQGVGEPVVWKLTLIDPDTGSQRVLGSVSYGSSYAFAPAGDWLVLADGDTGELSLARLDNFAERRLLGHGFLPTWGRGDGR